MLKRVSAILLLAALLFSASCASDASAPIAPPEAPEDDMQSLPEVHSSTYFNFPDFVPDADRVDVLDVKDGIMLLAVQNRLEESYPFPTEQSINRTTSALLLFDTAAETVIFSHALSPYQYCSSAALTQAGFDYITIDIEPPAISEVHTLNRWDGSSIRALQAGATSVLECMPSVVSLGGNETAFQYLDLHKEEYCVAVVSEQGEVLPRISYSQSVFPVPFDPALFSSGTRFVYSILPEGRQTLIIGDDRGYLPLPLSSGDTVTNFVLLENSIVLSLCAEDANGKTNSRVAEYDFDGQELRHIKLNHAIYQLAADASGNILALGTEGVLYGTLGKHTALEPLEGISLSGYTTLHTIGEGDFMLAYRSGDRPYLRRIQLGIHS